MIITKNGKVMFEGTNEEILQDAICTIQAFADSKKFSKNFLHKMVDLAFMTDEELDIKNAEQEKEFSKKLDEIKRTMEKLKSNSKNKADTDNFKKIFGDIL